MNKALICKEEISNPNIWKLILTNLGLSLDTSHIEVVLKEDYEKENKKIDKVIINVNGGVAYVEEKPDNIEVEIRDYDCQEEDNGWVFKKDENGKTYQEFLFSEENKRYSDEQWEIAERLNNKCSYRQFEEAKELIEMAMCLPKNRDCDMLSCIYHHPDNARTHSYIHLTDKCSDCIYNKKNTSGENAISHYEI
jgi:hypothetical protein